MRRNKTKRRLPILPLLLCLGMAAVACHPYTQYDEYRHTDAKGWDRDTLLCFDVPPADAAGTYAQTLHLRTDNTYPFQQLCLVVEQEVVPSKRQILDTLTFNIYDADGDNEGRGFSLYQNEKLFRFLSLHQGDSLHICVHHFMQRHILPGIHDVGMKLEMTEP